MRLPTLLLCALLFPCQDDPSKLIEQLRSDRAETRREARRKLKELGKAARPELEKATRDADAEVAGTAKELLHVLAISESLTTRLKEEFPGVAERLATGADRVWTETFLQAVGEEDGKPLHPGLQREDLEPLAAPAFQGADSSALKHQVMAHVAARRLKTAAPALARLLQDEDANIPVCAAFFLGYLGSKEAVAGLRKSLQAPNPELARRSVRALGQLGATDAVPDLVNLLKDSNPDLRKGALKSLIKMGAKEAAASIADLVNDPAVEVRVAAASWLCDQGRTDGVATIFKECENDRLNWEEAPPLTFLNALRTPEAWRKLTGKSLEWKLTGTWGLEGTRAKTLERIAAEAGLKLDILPDAEWGRGEESVQIWCGPTTLPEDLMILLYGSGFDVLLESDRLRIVPHAEALKFWQDWWKERSGKK